jgi:hypothetical protein
MCNHTILPKKKHFIQLTINGIIYSACTKDGQNSKASLSNQHRQFEYMKFYLYINVYIKFLWDIRISDKSLYRSSHMITIERNAPSWLHTTQTCFNDNHREYNSRKANGAFIHKIWNRVQRIVSHQESNCEMENCICCCKKEHQE